MGESRTKSGDGPQRLTASTNGTHAGQLSYSAALVMQALSEGHMYGFDIMRSTQLPSGTVYPLLRRLETTGFIDSAWEDSEPAHAKGGPARRYYSATAEGRAALIRARARLAAQRALFLDVDAGAEPDRGTKPGPDED